MFHSMKWQRKVLLIGILGISILGFSQWLNAWASCNATCSDCQTASSCSISCLNFECGCSCYVQECVAYCECWWTDADGVYHEGRGFRNCNGGGSGGGSGRTEM